MNFKKLILNPKLYANIAYKRIRNRVRVLCYRGDLVVCEICNWQGKKFFEGCCPKCNSLPRTRLIPFSLAHFKLLNDTPKLLHVAPNVNEFNYIKAKVAPLDSYDRLNIRPVKHINIVQDLTNTNLKEFSYDLAIAWHVLEHIPKDQQAIAEVYRLLKKGGHFLVSVPIYPLENTTTFEDVNLPYEDYERIHGHYDHCRSCGLDYYKRFEAIGFKVSELLVKDLETEFVDRFGLRTDHVVWCFTK